MGRFPKLGTLFNRDFRNSYNQGVDKIDAELDAQINRVDNLIANAPQPSEVVDARGGEAVLGNRLNNFDTQLAQNMTVMTDPPGNNYFTAGTNFGSSYFRIPFIEVTNNDVIICGGDARYEGSNDIGVIDIGIARSRDGGKIWFDNQIVLANSQATLKSRVHDGTILVNRNTNRVFIFGLEVNSDNGVFAVTTAEVDFVYKYSDDDGDTWSSKQSLKHLFPVGSVVMYPGIGKGITMKDGTLAVPVQVKQPNGNVPEFQSGVIISNDNGLTWSFNGGLLPVYSSECNVVESQDGMLLMNARSNISARRIFNSWDKGATWYPYPTDAKTLVEPGGCQGSSDVVTIGNAKYGLFINPNESENDFFARKNITLKATNDFVHWYPVHTFTKDHTDGYSCITNKDDKLYAVIERKGSLEFHDLTGVKNNIPNTKIDRKVDTVLESIHFDAVNKELKISPSVSIVRVPTISGNIIEKISGAEVGQIITLVKAGAEFYVKTFGSPAENGIYGFTASGSNDLLACMTVRPIVLQYTKDKKWVLLSEPNYAKDRYILTTDVNGYITVTPGMKMIHIDVANSLNTWFKGIKGAEYGQEFFITNLVSANPLTFNYNVDALPALGDNVVTPKETYFPHIRADFKNNHTIVNVITHGEWLHCVISGGFAEIVNIREFSTPIT